MLNTHKFLIELKNANILNGGCNELGIVWAQDGTTEIQDRDDVKAIIIAHNPIDNDAILQEEYKKAGITNHSLISALWKKIMQDDPADADALQTLINDVDSTIA